MRRCLLTLWWWSLCNNKCSLSTGGTPKTYIMSFINGISINLEEKDSDHFQDCTINEMLGSAHVLEERGWGSNLWCFLNKAMDISLPQFSSHWNLGEWTKVGSLGWFRVHISRVYLAFFFSESKISGSSSLMLKTLVFFFFNLPFPAMENIPWG